MEIVKILNDFGFKTVVGKDAVLTAIKDASDGKSVRLCSGFKVFPNGEKCPGCIDCIGK